MKKVEKPTVGRAGLSSPIGLVFTPTMGLDTKVLYYPITSSHQMAILQGGLQFRGKQDHQR